MPHVDIDGTGLYYEATGTGEPVVFVHGNWTDHSVWGPLVAELPPGLRTIAYDRRGSSRSQRSRERVTRRLHEDDLAALIERLGPAPAHVVASSFGGSTALGLAARRPELIRSVVAHEPPLVAIVAGDSAVAATEASVRAVIARAEACDAEGAAAQFTEEVALGPGWWARLPGPVRAMMIANASIVAEEMRDPDFGSVDLEGLAAVNVPILLTRGDQSPAWFRGIVDELARAVGREPVTLAGTGHNPHVTHPAAFAEVVAEHARAAEAVR
jgi:pimeloyl-ACP methyl ester carboxylesterase